MEGYRNTVVQATDANRPTLVPNVLDGHPAIRFGGSHWLQSLAQFGVVAGDRPRMYVVGSYATALTSFTQALASYDNTAVTNRGFYLSHGGTLASWLLRRAGSIVLAQVANAAGNNSVPVLFDGRADASSVTLAINGIDIATGAAAPPPTLEFTPNGINVGQVVDGTQLLTGDIFCVIVLNNETASSHATIMNYLATKYPSLGLGTPKGILGPLYHSDFDVADPGATITAGAVESIPNRGLHPAPMVQATAGLRPTYSATSFPGGGPGATFNGIDQRMTCTFAPAIPSGRRPYLWLVVQPLNASQGNQTACCVTASGGWMLCYARSAPSLTSFSLNMAASGAEQVDFPAASIANSHLMEVGCTTAGTAGAVLDSVAKNFATASGPTLNTALTIQFGSLGGSQFGNCIIRRVILADDLPSQAQIDAMRAYLLAQPYGLPQQKPPLPASAVEYWHSELECTAASWKGQISGRVLTASGTPVVAADPGYFNGRVVVATGQTTGTSYLINTGPDLYPAASYPWVMMIARLRSGIAGNKALATVGRYGTNVHFGVVQTTSNYIGTLNSSAAVVTGPAHNTNVHNFKIWGDGTLAHFKVDGADATFAFTPSTPNSGKDVWIGDSLGGSLNTANVNTAFFLVCSSKPSDAEIAALDQWAQAYWGVP